MAWHDDFFRELGSNTFPEVLVMPYIMPHPQKKNLGEP